MNNRNFSRTTKGIFFFCVVSLAVFAAANLYLGNSVLALTEGLFTLAVVLLVFYREKVRRTEGLRYRQRITEDLGAASEDTLVNAPLPMAVFRPESGEIIWTNDRFLKILVGEDHLFDRTMEEAVGKFDTRWLSEGKRKSPGEMRIGDRRYEVYGHITKPKDGTQGESTATCYWVDVTDFSHTSEQFHATRPCVALLELDNYDEFLKGVSDNLQSALLSDIRRRISEWSEPTHALLCRYDRSHYVMVFEEQYLPEMREKNFDVLSSVREVVNPSGIAATLSLGVGLAADSFDELHQYATLALDMALSRGGDQAVLKDRFNFSFYGGTGKETEKHTKVKSRVMASALRELIRDAEDVYIMGHRLADLDCIGAAVGIAAAARKSGVPAFIIEEKDEVPAQVLIDELKTKGAYGKAFISADDAMLRASAGSLLVVVDTNRPEQMISPAFLESVNKVAVIDHHRRAASYIEGATFSFLEPFASSAGELVTELLQYILDPGDLTAAEAEALMAGIVLDTKNFVLRAGTRTFDAASYLRRSGADTTAIQRFFKRSLADAALRYEVVKDAKTYGDNIAVSVLSHTVSRVVAAQAADELLTISAVDTSFVIVPEGNGSVISARSSGKINVQLIMEKLGGGGNAAAAGAQIPDTAPPQVAEMLRQTIDEYRQTTEKGA